MKTKYLWFFSASLLALPISANAVMSTQLRTVTSPQVITTTVTSPNIDVDVVESDGIKTITPVVETEIEVNSEVRTSESGSTGSAVAPTVTGAVSSEPSVTVSSELNPQPEPPAPVASVITGDTVKIVGTALSQAESASVVSVAPTIIVEVNDEIKTENNEVKIMKGEQPIGLRSTPENFSKDLSMALKNNGFVSDAVGEIKLQVLENKPVYIMKVKEKAKLFGFIPMTIKTDVTVSAENNGVQSVKRPWYARLAKLVNNVSNLKLVPDFALTNLEIISSSYHVGGTASARVTLANNGTAGAMTDFSVFGSGTQWEVYNGSAFVTKFLAGPVYISPGQSYTFDLGYKIYNCETVKVDFDPGNFLGEEDTSNNTIAAQPVCVE